MLITRAIMAFAILLCTNGAQAQTAKQTAYTAEKPLQWKNVGADPCKVKAGCTKEWALSQTGWPADVQKNLIAAVKNDRPSEYFMESGWTGWMTFGQSTRKFVMYTKAAWTPGKTEVSDSWSFLKEDHRTATEVVMAKYNLYQVRKCGNWAGDKEIIRRPLSVKPPAIVPQPEPELVPLGVLPRVECP